MFVFSFTDIKINTLSLDPGFEAFSTSDPPLLLSQIIPICKTKLLFQSAETEMEGGKKKIILSQKCFNIAGNFKLKKTLLSIILLEPKSNFFLAGEAYRSFIHSENRTNKHLFIDYEAKIKMGLGEVFSLETHSTVCFFSTYFLCCSELYFSLCKYM